jgi:hypothetical protein
MENSGGSPYLTQLYIQLSQGFTTEWKLGFTMLEDNPTLPQKYQGTYDYESGTVGMDVTPASCITLTSAVVAQGGNVAASLHDCAFSGGMVQNRGRATITGNLTAKFEGMGGASRAPAPVDRATAARVARR